MPYVWIGLPCQTEPPASVRQNMFQSIQQTWRNFAGDRFCVRQRHVENVLDGIDLGRRKRAWVRRLPDADPPQTVLCSFTSVRTLHDDNGLKRLPLRKHESALSMSVSILAEAPETAPPGNWPPLNPDLSVVI